MIFLCWFDPVGFAECKYETVHVLKHHTDYVIDDKRHILLYDVNEYLKSDDAQLRAFFEYMATGKAESEFSKEVQDVVNEAKTDDTLRSGYMTFDMELKSRCRDAHDAGIKEGIAEGEARGIIQGRREGEARGIKKGEASGAKKTNLANALKMKLEKLPFDLISRVTGLTPEQVELL